MSEIRPFDPEKDSDGCSGGLSKAWEAAHKIAPWLIKHDKLIFHRVCVEHDERYYYGGSRYDKKVADRIFRRDVADVLWDNGMWYAADTVAWVMWKMVRRYGGPERDTPYRWGYGYPYPRGYE